jgi:hypothetical protein
MQAASFLSLPQNNSTTCGHLCNPLIICPLMEASGSGYHMAAFSDMSSAAQLHAP